MKKLICLYVVVFHAAALFAQGGEWLRQKNTQKKYLLQQIAALKIYSGYVSKGYSIAKSGINTIQNIKQGDFKLHIDYFNSLLTVNAKIRKYQRVADIIAIQIRISKLAGNTILNLSRRQQFTPSEITYLKQVFDNLLSGCAQNLDDLFVVISDGQLNMKDDERIKAIDRLYADMQGKQVFARWFSNSAAGLSVQRSNELNDIMISKKLNGLQ